MLTQIKSAKILPQLNIIRAIASLAVAIFHLGGKKVAVLNYGWLGVEMFFVLTGFVICWALPANYSLKDFRTFFSKRIIRVEPPYIISILLILVVYYSLNGNLNAISLKNVALHFAYLNNFFANAYLSPVYWTLGVEMQYYLLIGLIFPFITKNKNLSLLILIIFNLITLCLSSKYVIVSNYFPLFTLGILTYLFKTNKLSQIEFLIFSLLNFGSIFYVFGLECLIVSALTASIILFIHKSNPVINFFSKISFSLYLTHDIVGSKFVIYFGKLFTDKNTYTNALSFCCALGFSILFAYLFYIVIEDYFLKQSKKIKYAIAA